MSPPQDQSLAEVGGVTEAGAVAQVAREAGRPHDLGESSEAMGVLVPDGAHYEVHDLEKYGLEPWRKRGHVTLHEHTSFADYIVAHAIDGTAVYADVRAGSITAVVNDHGPESSGGVPGWGDHRAVLDLRHSHEWNTWTARDGRLTSQADFAEHLEDNYVDITDPDHATMLEVASSIEATTQAAFRSRQRLSDGQVALRYEETVEAKAGQKGDLTIPETFTVALRVYEGLNPVEVTARLRYRIREGQLWIGYRLERLDDVKDAAFAGVVDEVTQRSGHTCLRGAAPDPVAAGR